MAGKKPAKPMAGQGKQVTLDPSIYGQSIKISGNKASPTSCNKCGRSVIRGMMRILGDKFYCSITCMKPAQDLDD
jgi:hypothetical protein